MTLTEREKDFLDMYDFRPAETRDDRLVFRSDIDPERPVSLMKFCDRYGRPCWGSPEDGDSYYVNFRYPEDAYIAVLRRLLRTPR